MGKRRRRGRRSTRSSSMDLMEFLRFFNRKTVGLRSILAEVGEPVVIGSFHPAKSQGELALRIAVPTLDEPVLERLLLRFRPFWLEGEQVNFLYVLSQLGRERPEYQPWLRAVRNDWNQCLFFMQIGDVRLTPAIVLKAALNADYFHFDENAAAELRELQRVFGASCVRAALVTTVWHRADLICKFADEIEATLDL